LEGQIKSQRAERQVPTLNRSNLKPLLAGQTGAQIHR
jgi:hypothetical protein